MAVNLREQVEADLAITLEGEWKLPVVLVAPDGTVYNKSKNDPEEDLGGMVLYDTYSHNVSSADIGGDLINTRPLVVLRRTSLERIPEPGEAWAVKIPDKPNRTADKVTYIAERAPETGESHGWIKLYLVKAEQST